jgi:hypothetical protein
MNEIYFRGILLNKDNLTYVELKWAEKTGPDRLRAFKIIKTLSFSV